MKELSTGKISGREKPFEITVLGEPASKANSRRIAVVNGSTRFIKSAKALRYLEDFQWQCRALDPMFETDVGVDLTIYYASRRSDLDESLILDAMQNYVYRNDRQVKRKLVVWGLDPANPRTEIRVYPISA